MTCGRSEGRGQARAGEASAEDATPAPEAAASDPAAAAPAAPSFLDGGGRCGAILRGLDWSAHPLGAPAGWPAALKLALRVTLTTEHPVFVFWGSEHWCFYNDAYSRSVGPERHPGMMGVPGRLVWDEIWDVIGPQIDQVMSGRGATWNENHLVPITRDGRREDVWWTYSYSPIDEPSAPSGVGGVLVLCAETTAQMRALREARELEAVYEAAPMGLCVLDRALRYLRINERLAAINGRPAVDHMGRSVTEMLPPALAATLAPFYSRVLAGETVETLEVAGPHPAHGGPGVWLVSGRPFGAPDDPGRALLVTVVDVTERRAADRALAESEARLRLGLSIAEIGLGAIDYGADAITLDATAAAIFDLPADRPLPRAAVHARIHPEDWRSLGPEISALVGAEGGGVLAIDRRILLPDGRERRIAARKQVFHETGPDGVRRAAHGLLALRDVTEERRAEETLRLLNAELETRVAAAVAEREAALAQLHEAQKMEALGRMTGGVAHDFNNLIAAMLSNLEAARRRSADPEAARLMEGAMQAAERGAGLTRRLLAFARRQTLAPEPVALAPLVAGMLDMLARTLGPSVAIRVEVPRELPPVLVDRNQLELAILNLAVNARDAMPDGGALTISAQAGRGDAAPPLEARACVRLTVADDGVGMDEAVRRRAVEPFFTTKPPGQGTGLGLSSVHGLAAQSGGALTIESAPGLGAAVTLWLPQALDAEDGSATAEAPAPEPARPRALRVLLVEDDALVAMGAAAMLEDLGHDAITAGSGGEALAILEGGVVVDLVVTDQGMPGMTGVEFARALARRRPSLPVILATGHAEADLAGDPGLHRLAKPYTTAALARAIAAALEAGGAA